MADSGSRRNALVVVGEELSEGFGGGVVAEAQIGWHLTVWQANGMPELTAISNVPFIRSYLHPGRNAAARFLAYEFPPTSSRTPFTIDSFDPVAEADPQKLAAAHAARVALAIYERAIAVQGPSVYLAVCQEQKHVSAVNPPAGPGFRFSGQ